jgi:hypothetical protein
MSCSPVAGVLEGVVERLADTGPGTTGAVSFPSGSAHWGQGRTTAELAELYAVAPQLEQR